MTPASMSERLRSAARNDSETSVGAEWRTARALAPASEMRGEAVSGAGL